MIATHTVILHRDRELRDPVTLEYVEETLRGSQRRLLGRTVVRPLIELGAYRWASVVDWIDVEFELGRPSQHWHLNDRIEALTGRKEYPEALDVGPGGTATRYRLRVQEPDFGQLRGVLTDIRSEYGFAAPALVVGIEVCIDAYPLRPSEEARARLHGVLVRHFFPTTSFLKEPEQWPRAFPGRRRGRKIDYIVARREGDPEGDFMARMTPGHDRPPFYDATVYVGRKDDPLASWRIQNKVIDKQNLKAGTQQILSEAEKRIRIEVSLGPEGCRKAGLGTFDALGAFRFTRMQKMFFQFMKPTFAAKRIKSRETFMPAIRNAVDDLGRQRFLNAGVLGVQIREDARDEMARLHRPRLRNWHLKRGSGIPGRSRTGAGAYGRLVAYQELARAVERALAGLQRRIEAEMKR
ncbi:hypothetical protein SAMN05880582_107190 [Rhizobium sp. RU20A]|uniref:hypothetical protein n=1 Tax=Rhizobium sp. RU20A TaxID=1907412 RepID=UPI000954160E|nr:hypothetical protein [Rhizobium sp. RU20A]SIR19241.1 hypothetical protein SAMN05880582_107190 [Rhizobium sp. RU20A]